MLLVGRQYAVAAALSKGLVSNELAGQSRHNTIMDFRAVGEDTCKMTIQKSAIPLFTEK